MKIGLFVDSNHPRTNGVIPSIDVLKKGLEKLGHQVIIITGGNTKQPVLKDDVLLLPSITLNSCRIIDMNSKINLSAVKDLHLDIIHSHTELTVGLFANKVAKKLGVANIHTYHTRYNQNQHYTLRRNVLRDCIEAMSVNSFCNDKIDALITTSEKEASYLKNVYDIENEPYIIKEDFNEISIETGNNVQDSTINFDSEKYVQEVYKVYKKAYMKQRIGINF